MKFQIVSDLHLEFEANRDWIKNHPLIPKSEYLIIAGDTYYLDRDYLELDFIRKVSDEFYHVYLIPGNHEYYGGFDVAAALDSSCLKICTNVTVLDNLYQFVVS